MTQKIKDSYQIPAVKVLEVKFEGFICQTTLPEGQGEVPGYGDEYSI